MIPQFRKRAYEILSLSLGLIKRDILRAARSSVRGKRKVNEQKYIMRERMIAPASR